MVVDDLHGTGIALSAAASSVREKLYGPRFYESRAMVLLHAALALMLSGLSVAILTAGLRLRARRPLRSLFVVFFLATWAGGIWMAPFGPPIGRVYWVPFTLIAILIAAVLPPEVTRRPM